MRRDRDRLADILEATTKIRHRVVHDYFAIDPDILWTAATRDIPPLAAQIHTTLDQLPPEPP